MPQQTDPFLNKIIQKKNQQQDPFLDKVVGKRKDLQQEDDPYEEGFVGSFKKLGRDLSTKASYIGSIADQAFADTPLPPIQDNINRDLAVTKQLVKNVGSLIDLPVQMAVHGIARGLGYEKENPNSIINTIKSQGKDILNDPASIPAKTLGAIADQAQDIVEATTGTVNDNGVAVPSTPQQQAQNLQSAVGTVAMIGTFGAVKSALTPLGSTIQEATQLAGRSYPAKLASMIGANTAATSASGAVQGAISGAGEEDNLDRIIGGAITYVPLGVAMGMFGEVGKYNKTLAKNIESLNRTPEIATDLASLNSIRAQAERNTYGDLLDNIDLVKTSDDLVEVAVRSNFNQGKGFVAENLSGEKLKELRERLEIAKSTNKEPEYTLHPKLARAQPTYKGVGIKFESDLDKIAYILSKKTIGKNDAMYMEDLVRQTGLSEAEIISHGKAVRENIQRSQITNRNQFEIDAHLRGIVEKGKAKLEMLYPGDTFKDHLGKEWLIDNNNNLTNGSLVYPKVSQEAMAIAGRTAKDEVGFKGFVDLKKTQWDPNFGRDNKLGFNMFQRGNLTLFIPESQNFGESTQFFKDHGFLPGEILSRNGRQLEILRGDKGGMKIRDVQGSFYHKLPASELKNLRRENGSSGRLTPEKMLESLYQEFLPTFKESTESFRNTFQKYLISKNVSKTDFNNIETYFYKKLGDDLASELLDNDELVLRAKTTSDLLDFDTGYNLESRTIDQATILKNAAQSNNMFYSATGAGRYQVGDLKTGKIYGTVSNPTEALDLINKSGQVVGYALDGGDTGAIPTSIMRVGSEFQQPKPNWVDGLVISSIGQKAFSFPRVVASIDNIAEGKTSMLRDVVLPLNDAQVAKRNYFLSIEPLNKQAQDIITNTRSIDQTRLNLISDAIESRSIEETANNFLSRPMNAFEQKMAQKLSKLDVRGIADLILAAKEIDPDIQSPKFNQALMEIGEKNFDLETIKGARTLLKDTNLSQEIYAPHAVLELAKQLQSPEFALTRNEFMSKHGFNGKERMLVSQLDGYFDKIFDQAGIDSRARMQGYLPHIQAGEIFSNHSAVPEGFARELTRLVNDGSLERDPAKLVMAYHRSLVNHKSGFNDALKLAQDKLDINIEGIKANQGLVSNQSLMAGASKVGQYIDDVRGIPNVDDVLAKASSNFFQRMGLKTPGQNSVLAAFSLGNIAGRPALAMRDGVQAYSIGYGAFGHKWANKMMGSSISDEYMNQLTSKGIIPEDAIRSSKNNTEMLVDQGILPKTTFKNLIDPASEDINFSSLESKGSKLFDKTVEVGYQLGGQEYVYNKILAGAYKATFEEFGPVVDDYLGSKITRDKMISEIGLSAHSPSVQKIFIDMVEAGKTGEALDMLGKWNGRYVSNIFGMNNSPQGWKTGFGRLLGQYGQYASNNAVTMLEMVSRGSKMDIAKRGMRLGIVNGVMVAAGAQVGVDLKKWITGNPFTLLPTMGPVATMMGDITEQYNRTGDFGSTGSFALRQVKSYIPFKRAYDGWQEAYDRIGDWNAGQVVMRGLGQTGIK